MKKEFYLLLIVTLTLVSCNPDTLKTDRAPSDVSYTGGFELKMFLLLEGDLAQIEKCSVLAEITDKGKVFRIYDALDDARFYCRSYDSFTPKVNQKAICFVDANDQGFIIRMGWNKEEEKVTFAGGYSETLYKVLTEYGIIESEKRPDVEFFSSDPELAKIRFAPMPEYIGRHGKLKKVVFLEGHYYQKIEEWRQLTEVTEPKEIEKIKRAFSTAKYCVMHLLEGMWIETAIVFIYEDGRDELLIIDPNREDQIVEFQGGYSKELYEILVAHGIIKPDK
jgi:hypothetical protein